MNGNGDESRRIWFGEVRVVGSQDLSFKRVNSETLISHPCDVK